MWRTKLIIMITQLEALLFLLQVSNATIFLLSIVVLVCMVKDILEKSDIIIGAPLYEEEIKLEAIIIFYMMAIIGVPLIVIVFGQMIFAIFSIIGVMILFVCDIVLTFLAYQLFASGVRRRYGKECFARMNEE